MFRAAGLVPNLVRIIVIRDDAIDSFAISGNRMLTGRAGGGATSAAGWGKHSPLGDVPEERR